MDQYQLLIGIADLKFNASSGCYAVLGLELYIYIHSTVNYSSARALVLEQIPLNYGRIFLLHNVTVSHSSFLISYNFFKVRQG